MPQHTKEAPSIRKIAGVKDVNETEPALRSAPGATRKVPVEASVAVPLPAPAAVEDAVSNLENPT